jgi:hypothetical protein
LKWQWEDRPEGFALVVGSTSIAKLRIFVGAQSEAIRSRFEMQKAN